MKDLRRSLAIVIMLLIVCPFVSAVGTRAVDAAPVETAEGTFWVKAVAGTIGGARFDSATELATLLAAPIVAGTPVEISVTLELRQPTPPYGSFLRLRSGLTDVAWDAAPSRLKGVVVWSYDGEETYLWVPPSHDVSEMTISLSGDMFHPVMLTTFRTSEGGTVERALIKEVAAEILLVEMRTSRATFQYTADPWAWVKDSVLENRTLRVEGVATNNIIEQANTEIQGMQQLLAVLEGTQVQNRLTEMPDEVGTMLRALITDVRGLVDSGASLLEAGYPDVFLMMAGSMKAATQDTESIVARIRGVAEYESVIASSDERIGVLEDKLGTATRSATMLGVGTGVFCLGTVVFFVMWRGVRRRLGDYLRG